MSAHADRGEILRWLRTFPAPPGKLYLVHGEPASIEALKALIVERLQWTTPNVPQHKERIDI